MIEWKKFNAQTAPEEIEEDDWLIHLDNGRIIHVTHNAMERYFYREMEDHNIVYPYSKITHYAEIDWPEIESGPMIDECEHGKVLVCEECAKRHQSTLSRRRMPNKGLERSK